MYGHITFINDKFDDENSSTLQESYVEIMKVKQSEGYYI